MASPRRKAPAQFRSRVWLRALTADDLETLADWHEGVEALRSRLRAGERLMAITLRDADRSIGVLEYVADAPEAGWLALGGARVEPELRGLGLEAEAVRLVEAEGEKRGVSQFVAEVDREDGLALYFWLRLGYRPYGKPRWRPEAQRDIIALVRTP